jgi:hypothetical protein
VCFGTARLVERRLQGVQAGPTARSRDVSALFGALRCRGVELEGLVGSEGLLHTFPGSMTRISISQGGLGWAGR